MFDHAGFAAAVTVREHVLNTALLAAHANGAFPKVLKTDLPGGPPEVSVELFLDTPVIDCEASTNLLVLTVRVRGPVRVTADGAEHVARIAGELEVTIRPVFLPGPSLRLAPENNDVAVRRWTAAVTSPGMPADVVSYVTGDGFRERLQQAIRFAIAFQLVKLPTIDVAFLGPLARIATSVHARVRNNALLLGLNIENDDVSIVGNVNALTDFAQNHDLAGVINASATILLLDELHTRMRAAVEAEDANLRQFSVTPQSGHFLVRGAVSKSSGTVNFSFRVVPRMFHTRPGATFHYLPKTRRVKSRTWPALGFRIDGVDTDVDRSWWVLVLDIFGFFVTAGLLTLFIESLVKATEKGFSGQIKRAETGAPAARVRRTIPPPGGVAVRIGLDQFEIGAAGTFVGISVRAMPTTLALLGPTSVPSTYADDTLRHILRLPSDTSPEDPALRVRWTLEDRTNDIVLADEDAPAAARPRFDFSPAAFPGVTDFGVTARLYRRIGTNVTELGIKSLNVHLRGPLPAQTYVRWRSEVSNPQISLNEATDTWNYNGEARVRRWSEWHRRDAPCRAVNAPNRYRFDFQTADRLPFSLKLLENHRKGLCPYCFFGGPAGLNAEL
jgi:hypothetical protein